MCLCVCPCAHMLTRGSFQAEVLWVKTVTDLEVCVCCHRGVESGGGNGLGDQPHRAWAGRKPSAPSVGVPVVWEDECLQEGACPAGFWVQLRGLSGATTETWRPSLLPCFD